jgi:hypothetical protein
MVSLRSFDNLKDEGAAGADVANPERSGQHDLLACLTGCEQASEEVYVVPLQH